MNWWEKFDWEMFEIADGGERLMATGELDKCREFMRTLWDDKVPMTQYIGGSRERYRQIKDQGPEYEIRPKAEG